MPTILVSEATKKALETLKLHPRESYNAVIERVVIPKATITLPTEQRTETA
jgi:hypothetical protein